MGLKKRAQRMISLIDAPNFLRFLDKVNIAKFSTLSGDELVRHIPEEVKEEIKQLRNPTYYHGDIGLAFLHAVSAVVELSPVELQLVCSLAEVGKEEKDGRSEESTTDPRKRATGNTDKTKKSFFGFGK